MTEKILIVIVGATAVGKTELAIKVAKELKTEIISVDSRQFYTQLNIGTAKPSTQELNEVKHHFINSHSIEEHYNVGSFEKDALNLLENLFTKYTIVVATGGSGLFVKALCEGLDEMPSNDFEIRNKLQNDLEEKGLEYLVEKLKLLDEQYCKTADLQNPQRVMRALEVCLSTHQSYSSLRKNTKKERPFKIIKIGIERERQEIYQRIELRIDEMLENNLLEEAKNLIPYKNHNALQTVGYQEFFDFLENKYDWQECV
jgi:tRNA dimethylallyltransferase